MISCGAFGSPRDPAVHEAFRAAICDRNRSVSNRGRVASGPNEISGNRVLITEQSIRDTGPAEGLQGEQRSTLAKRGNSVYTSHPLPPNACIKYSAYSTPGKSANAKPREPPVSCATCTAQPQAHMRRSLSNPRCDKPYILRIVRADHRIELFHMCLLPTYVRWIWVYRLLCGELRKASDHDSGTGLELLASISIAVAISLTVLSICVGGNHKNK
jgi:hypothetical protein